MFTPGEWQSLVAAMQNKTLARTLNWKPAKRPESFQVQLNKQTMAILRSVDGDGQPPFELTIYRPGPEVEGEKTKWERYGTVDSTDMANAGWGGDSLQRLNETIVRIANEVDEVFQSIMDDLSSD